MIIRVHPWLNCFLHSGGLLLLNAAAETISLVAEYQAIRRDLFQPEAGRQGFAFPKYPVIDADKAVPGFA